MLLETLGLYGECCCQTPGHCRCGAAREEWEVQNDGGALHLCTSPVLGDKGKKNNKQQLYGENKKAMLKLLYKSSCKMYLSVPPVTMMCSVPLCRGAWGAHRAPSFGRSGRPALPGLQGACLSCAQLVLTKSSDTAGKCLMQLLTIV